MELENSVPQYFDDMPFIDLLIYLFSKSLPMIWFTISIIFNISTDTLCKFLGIFVIADFLITKILVENNLIGYSWRFEYNSQASGYEKFFDFYINRDIVNPSKEVIKLFWTGLIIPPILFFFVPFYLLKYSYGQFFFGIIIFMMYCLNLALFIKCREYAENENSDQNGSIEAIILGNNSFHPVKNDVELF